MLPTLALTSTSRGETLAKRETRQAERSAATNERPIDGGGEDHAFRTQAEAAAGARAERAVDQNQSKPIPADVNRRRGRAPAPDLKGSAGGEANKPRD